MATADNTRTAGGKGLSSFDDGERDTTASNAVWVDPQRALAALSGTYRARARRQALAFLWNLHRIPAPPPPPRRTSAMAESDAMNVLLELLP